MPHLPDHQSDHDPLLVAAYAAGDAAGEDLERARELVATCDECAALHHDLRAIAAAMPALPVPARSRDFRLTPEQAASLRPAAWRRLLAPLAGPRFAFAAPLGGSLAALGLAGVLVAGAFSGSITGAAPATTGGSYAANPAASIPDSERLGVAASSAPSSGDAALAPVASPAASTFGGYLSAPAASMAAVPAPGGGIVETDGAGSGGGAAGGIAGTGPAASEAAPVDNGGTTSSTRQEQPSAVDVAGPIETTTPSSTAGSTGVPPVVPVVSAVLLLVGLGLLGLALIGRRVGRATG
jgi:hypothetical protein